MELQIEVNAKMKKLAEFQNELNDRCHRITMKIDYMDLSGPTPFKGPQALNPLPDHTAMPQIQLSSPWTVRSRDSLLLVTSSLIVTLQLSVSGSGPGVHTVSTLTPQDG